MRILFSPRPSEHNARGLLRAFCVKRETLGRSRQRMGPDFLGDAVVKAKTFCRFLLLGRGAGHKWLMDPLYEWSTANQMGLPLLQLLSFSRFRLFMFFFFPFVFFFFFFVNTFTSDVPLSNQEILVTLSSRSLGNSMDMYISGKINDAWRKRKIIHNFYLWCLLITGISNINRKSWRRHKTLISN